MGEDHAVVRVGLVQRGHLRLHFAAQGIRVDVGCCVRGAHLRLPGVFGLAAGSVVCAGRVRGLCFEALAQVEHLIDDLFFAGVAGIKRGQPVRQFNDFALDLGDAVFVALAQIAGLCLAGKLCLERVDPGAGGGDTGGQGGLAERYAGAGGIQKRDRLVRQLPGRDVAVRERDRADDGSVGNTHFVVVLHRAKDTAQHVAADLD